MKDLSMSLSSHHGRSPVCLVSSGPVSRSVFRAQGVHLVGLRLTNSKNPHLRGGRPPRVVEEEQRDGEGGDEASATRDGPEARGGASERRKNEKVGTHTDEIKTDVGATKEGEREVSRRVESKNPHVPKVAAEVTP